MHYFLLQYIIGVLLKMCHISLSDGIDTARDRKSESSSRNTFPFLKPYFSVYAQRQSKSEDFVLFSVPAVTESSCSFIISLDFISNKELEDADSGCISFLTAISSSIVKPKRGLLRTDASGIS